MATTFRLEPKLQTALQTLSAVTKRPMNKLVNEAVARYVDERGPRVEQELESMVAALRAYRASDPDDEKAIAAFAEAEATIVDPVEGRLTTKREGQPSRLAAKTGAHA